MPFSPEHLTELNLLVMFSTPSLQEGIKVHRHDATPEVVAAAERLHQKGLITNNDGGYLTDLGFEAVDHTQKLMGILSTD